MDTKTMLHACIHDDVKSFTPCLISQDSQLFVSPQNCHVSLSLNSNGYASIHCVTRSLHFLSSYSKLTHSLLYTFAQWTKIYQSTFFCRNDKIHLHVYSNCPIKSQDKEYRLNKNALDEATRCVGSYSWLFTTVYLDQHFALEISN